MVAMSILCAGLLPTSPLSFTVQYRHTNHRLHGLQPFCMCSCALIYCCSLALQPLCRVLAAVRRPVMFSLVRVQECRRVCQTGNEMLRHFWASFPWTSKQREEKAAKLDRALASHYDRSAML